MFRALKLRQMEVISIRTARRLGYIHDVEINESDGSVSAIIVRQRMYILRNLFSKRDCIIPWDKIAVAGRDLVLVDTD